MSATSTAYATLSILALFASAPASAARLELGNMSVGNVQHDDRPGGGRNNVLVLNDGKHFIELACNRILISVPSGGAKLKQILEVRDFYCYTAAAYTKGLKAGDTVKAVLDYTDEGGIFTLNDLQVQVAGEEKPRSFEGHSIIVEEGVGSSAPACR